MRLRIHSEAPLTRPFMRLRSLHSATHQLVPGSRTVGRTRRCLALLASVRLCVCVFFLLPSPRKSNPRERRHSARSVDRQSEARYQQSSGLVTTLERPVVKEDDLNPVESNASRTIALVPQKRTSGRHRKRSGDRTQRNRSQGLHKFSAVIAAPKRKRGRPVGTGGNKHRQATLRKLMFWCASQAYQCDMVCLQ